MNRNQLIQLYVQEHGFTPLEDEIDILMDQYHLGDEDTDLPPPRQQSRVYQFDRYSNNNNSDTATDDLLKEVKNIFLGICGSAKRSANKSDNDNMKEFGFMLLNFLLKSSLYFSLKISYSEGYDFSNL